MTEEQIFLEYLKLEEKYKDYKQDISLEMLFSWLKDIEIPGQKILHLEFLAPLDSFCLRAFIVSASPQKNYINNFLITKEHSLYQKILSEYTECNKRLADAISKVGDISPSIIAGIYYSILRDGYLSVEHQFAIETPSIDNNLFLPDFGITNISGKGVCRNISSQFSDILDLFDIKNSLIFVLLKETSIPLPLLGENKRITVSNQPFDTDTNQTLLRRRLAGNHVITAIEDNNKSLFLDVPNKSCYRKKNKYNLTTFKNTTDSIANIKHYSNYLYNTKYNSQISKSILQKPNISFSKANEEFYKGEIFVSDNTSLFDNLYEKNIDSYRKIITYLNELNKTLTPYLNYSKKTREEIRRKTLKL